MLSSKLQTFVCLFTGRKRGVPQSLVPGSFGPRSFVRVREGYPSLWSRALSEKGTPVSGLRSFPGCRGWEGEIGVSSQKSQQWVPQLDPRSGYSPPSPSPLDSTCHGQPMPRAVRLVGSRRRTFLFVGYFWIRNGMGTFFAKYSDQIENVTFQNSFCTHEYANRNAILLFCQLYLEHIAELTIARTLSHSSVITNCILFSAKNEMAKNGRSLN